MVKFWLHCSKTSFDISKALAIGYPGKRHTEVLIETGKRFCSMVAAISANASVELFFGKKV